MTTRANSDRIILLNCGVGRDSLTMWSLLLDGKLEVEGLGTLGVLDIDGVVFSDTGCEWPHTYEALERLREQCELTSTPLYVLAKPADHATGRAARVLPVDSLDDVLAKAEQGAYHVAKPSKQHPDGNVRLSVLQDLGSRSTVVSLGKGDCTDQHKIQPIRRLLADLARVRFGVPTNRAWGDLVAAGKREPHVTLIGIAADETSRLEGAKPGPRYVTERYPLVTMGIAKCDEQPHLEEWGHGSVRKSDCDVCPYQSAGWYWALLDTDPERFAEVEAYEARSLAKNANMSITGINRRKDEGGGKRTIREIVERWRTLNPGATVDAVLSKEYSRCTKDARAMRKAEAKALAAAADAEPQEAPRPPAKAKRSKPRRKPAPAPEQAAEAAGDGSQEWFTGQSFYGEGLESLVHVIRAPGDPERRDKAASLGGSTDGLTKTVQGNAVKRLPADVCAEAIVEHLSDGQPRTFNRLGVEIWDKTADILWQEGPDKGLWLAVEQGRIEHTSHAPILFRRRAVQSVRRAS
jgi:hypothetical protein